MNIKKKAVEGFNDSVKKNLDDAVLKINNKLDDINIEEGEVDYEEIKKKTKKVCTEALAKVRDFLPSIILMSQRDLVVKKFEELTGAYTRLKQENDILPNKLKPLIGGINYETVKEKCKEVLEEIQDFLESIPQDVDNLLKNQPLIQELSTSK
ncbi:17219_t:CDS:2 [Racocetra persica]|uniref:17219_t:CDS:1 n=1 Tax=Racocetra persica TaxID=160502 RepID=A0ACA9LPX1_9GLOM|nr:17219_t:CDS:2 [Racocetra persica]